VVISWADNNEESWLDEFLSILVSKGSWSPFSTKILSSGVETKFKNGSLCVWSAGSNEDIFLVFDGSNDSSGKHELLPCLINVVVVNSILVSTVSIVLHYLSTVLSSNVNGCGKHQGKIHVSCLRIMVCTAHI